MFGRFSRNLVERVVLNYALRVYGGGEGKEKNCKLVRDDFDYKVVEEKKKGVVGF